MKNYQLGYLLLILHLSVSIAKPQVYIVRVKEHPAQRTIAEIEEKHFSYLTTVKNSAEDAKSSVLYSYKHIINGFSALLTPDEAQKLSEMDEVVSVVKTEGKSYKTQTTRSWDFTNLLGGGNSSFSHGGGGQGNHGKDVVVGVLDTGVWPESQSFSDEGMEPIPETWKGTCQSGVAFNSSHCNRKLIGARYYLKGFEAEYGPLNETADFRSPRDRDGHGTHTSSTVAGREVPDTALLGGFANGTARGGAPLARLAIYKVCWATPKQPLEFESYCMFVDVLAAFDDAIEDGVHIISISIGSSENLAYDQDDLAIGALHAVRRGIVVVASAGNSGPKPSTVTNVAPWIMTVGASSIDRVFSSPVKLGNGMQIQGQTITPYQSISSYPLVYAGDAEIPNINTKTGQCLPGTLSPKLVQGKIVLCLSEYGRNVEKGLEVKRAGGAGFILQNPVQGISISVDAHVLPGTAVFFNNSASILKYIRTAQNPTAKLVPVETVLGNTPAPFMASFSSTGPNGLDPNILKPDITAPGLNILAAWSEAESPTKLYSDGRIVKYNIDSGTSMSCPHIAGSAALIKSAHPNWSSAAIRSAIMTTATQTNNIGQPITDGTGNSFATPFHYGSGHFQPQKATDPGLVYDVEYTDYLLYLCNFNSTAQTIDPSFSCPKQFPPPSDLNYPSVSVARVGRSGVSVSRTVTSVGGAGVYKVSVESPEGYVVEISPGVLNFSGVGQKESFRILIKVDETASFRSGYAFGWFSWSDGIHSVKSPLVVSS